MQRTVGLINTDTCVCGPIASPAASPVLKDVVVNALKMADDPATENPLENYYQFWKKWTNQVTVLFY